MIEIKFKDGTVKEFAEANHWVTQDCPDNIVSLVYRIYDEQGDYDEDEDKEVVLININEVYYILIK